jgi:periplasmic protein TonB
MSTSTTENTVSAGTLVNASAGHLSVHIPGAHPDDVPFLFERQPTRLGLSFVASLCIEFAAIVLVVLASRLGALNVTDMRIVLDRPSDQIIWIAEPGPGGGGGGGGNQMKEPPRKAELPGKAKLTVPVAKPPELEAPKEPPKVQPPPVEELNIPAVAQASAAEALQGLIDAQPRLPSTSQGPGSGGGAGNGRGVGIGPGTGSGLGPGSGGGTGGGPYRPGSGVSAPIALNVIKPQYTSEAMRARVQGVVQVECVVQLTGVCTDIQVIRSLDPTFGLDNEAVKAARQWRFKPGMRLGQPVPVLVTIELTFALR